MRFARTRGHFDFRLNLGGESKVRQSGRLDQGPPLPGSQQREQLLFRQAGLLENVAQGAGPDFSMQRHDRPPIAIRRTLLHRNMTAFLSQQDEPGPLQRPNQLSPRQRWQMAAHPATSMLVR